VGIVVEISTIKIVNRKEAGTFAYLNRVGIGEERPRPKIKKKHLSAFTGGEAHHWGDGVYMHSGCENFGYGFIYFDGVFIYYLVVVCSRVARHSI
jgi:hypothetical protein